MGLGRFEVADVAALLATGERGAPQDKGGPRVYKAPARGLCLHRCFYPGDDPEHDEAWPVVTPAQAMPSSEPADGGAAPASPGSGTVAAGRGPAVDSRLHQIKN